MLKEAYGTLPKYRNVKDLRQLVEKWEGEIYKMKGVSQNARAFCEQVVKYWIHARVSDLDAKLRNPALSPNDKITVSKQKQMIGNSASKYVTYLMKCGQVTAPSKRPRSAEGVKNPSLEPKRQKLYQPKKNIVSQEEKLRNWIREGRKTLLRVKEQLGARITKMQRARLMQIDKLLDEIADGPSLNRDKLVRSVHQDLENLKCLNTDVKHGFDAFCSLYSKAAPEMKASLHKTIKSCWNFYHNGESSDGLQVDTELDWMKCVQSSSSNAEVVQQVRETRKVESMKVEQKITKSADEDFVDRELESIRKSFDIRVENTKSKDWKPTQNIRLIRFYPGHGNNPHLVIKIQITKYGEKALKEGPKFKGVDRSALAPMLTVTGKNSKALKAKFETQVPQRGRSNSQLSLTKLAQIFVKLT